MTEPRGLICPVLRVRLTSQPRLPLLVLQAIRLEVSIVTVDAGTICCGVKLGEKLLVAGIFEVFSDSLTL